MQPLRFNPILKQKLWGGERIIPFKHLNSTLTQVGESWEISGLPGDETTVKEGPYAGLTLSEVIAQQRERLVGKTNYERYGTVLPLLVKFIDAAQPVSIQVHPSDETAHKYGLPNGKAEMWYMMDSSPGASLLVGLKERITPERYRTLVEEGTLAEVLNNYQVKEGDCFYLPGGRIHGIGKGCFLANIQQTCEENYRIFDYNRVGLDGHARQLHIKQAAECIDYQVKSDYRTLYVSHLNQGVALVHCPAFHSFVYDLTEKSIIDVAEVDSFIILVVTRGYGSLEDDEGNVCPLRAGDSLLLPATTRQFCVSGVIKFLMSYV